MTGNRLAPLLRPRSVAVLLESRDRQALARRPLQIAQAYGRDVRYVVVGQHAVANFDRVDDLEALAGQGTVDVLLAPELRGDLEAFLPLAARVTSVLVVTRTDGSWLEHRRRREVARLTDELGIVVMGPNALGMLNVTQKTSAFASYNVPEDLAPGGLAIASQSGALATSMLLQAHARGIGCGMVVATGAELVLPIAEIVEAVAQQPGTRAIALYIEGVAQPRLLFEAVAKARARNVEVVVLRAGRTRRGGEAAASHSGALASDDRRMAAAFADHGILEVDDLETLWATAAILAERGRPRGPRVAVLTPSGGLNVLLSDAVERAGLALAHPADATRTGLRRLLPDSPVTNPYEASGRILTDPRLLTEVVQAFFSDPSVDVGMFATNMMRGTRGLRMMEALAAMPVGKRPPVIMVPRAGPHMQEASEHAREAGMLTIDNLATAIAILAALSRSSQLDRVSGPRPRRLQIPPALLADHGEATELMRVVGIAMPQRFRVTSRSAAVRAARVLGGTVVLKAYVPGLIHKSDVGGVVVGVRTAMQAGAHFDAMCARFGADLRAVDVEEMVNGEAELILSVFMDADLGPMIGVGLGGIWTEVLDDLQLAMAPVHVARARQMLLRLRGAAVLLGGRSRPKVNLFVAARAIASLSHLASHLDQPGLVVEVNPLVVGRDRAVAVDVSVQQEASFGGRCRTLPRPPGVTLRA